MKRAYFIWSLQWLQLLGASRSVQAGRQFYDEAMSPDVTWKIWSHGLAAIGGCLSDHDLLVRPFAARPDALAAPHLN
jgi:hypothetical protein